MSLTRESFHVLLESCLVPDYDELAARILDSLENVDFGDQAADDFIQDLVGILDDLGEPLDLSYRKILNCLEKNVPILIQEHSANGSKV
jgi:hypothetical protein